MLTMSDDAITDVNEVEKLKGVVISLTDDRSFAIGVSVIESQGIQFTYLIVKYKYREVLLGG